MKHVNIVVAGRVQGVFFRASACEVANQLRISGFVRNEPDGTVYIEAEGDEPQLERFIAWCKKGPPRAHVARVETSEAGLKNFTSFEITR